MSLAPRRRDIRKKERVSRTQDQLPKVPVRLTGVDGNVFSVIGTCRRAALKGGWTQEEWSEFQGQLLKSEDYDHVLQRIMGAFEVS